MQGVMSDETAGRLLPDKVLTAERTLDRVKRSKNGRGNGHAPAGRGTTMPSDIRANDPDATPPPPVALTEIIQIDVDQIARHPANRHPTKEQIAERAESMQRDGQLEPIVVRPVKGGDRLYELISGETRWLAAIRLEWKSLAGRLVKADDQQALMMLAAANAQRADLNPIQTAELLHAMTKKGVPPAKAAEPFGKSESWAVNLIRLLELPEPWRGRVISGEIDATKARVLVPLVKAPRVLAAIDKEWEGGQWTDYPLRDLTRDAFTNEVERVIENHTRPVEGLTYDTYGERVLFNANDPKVRERLDIVELPMREGHGKKAKVVVRPRITNRELFDKLQNEARQKKGQAKLARDDAKEAKAKKVEQKLSPAELKARKEKQARQFTDRVAAWQHAFRRFWLADRLESVAITQPAIATALGRLTLYWFRAGLNHNAAHYRDRALARATEKKTRHDAYRIDQPNLAIVPLAAEWLWPSKGDDPFVLADWNDVDRDLVASLAGELGFDVKKAWADAQRDTPKGAKQLYQRMIELHSREQLAALGAELNVHIADGLPKSKAVALFTSVPRILPLPAVLKERKKRVNR